MVTIKSTNGKVLYQNKTAATVKQAVEEACKLEIDLSDADLSNQNLSHANLQLGEFMGADFSNSDLSYSNLDGADCKNCNFDNTIMVGIKNIETIDLFGAKYVNV